MLFFLSNCSWQPQLHTDGCKGCNGGKPSWKGRRLHLWRLSQLLLHEHIFTSMKYTYLPKTFHHSSKIHQQTQSEVAASPRKICFCDRVQFEGSVGYNYHCISKTSIAPVIAPGNSGELEEQRSVRTGTGQDVCKMCANLTYSVRTSQESIELHLSVVSLMDNQMPLSILNILFCSCPLGFNLSSSPPKCDCALQFGVKCTINTQLIHCPALVWIGIYSDEVVVHTNCPFDYCKPKDNDISLYEQNKQFAFNCSGVLCGACQPGVSLTLGTSQCMKCSNIYILLFIHNSCAASSMPSSQIQSSLATVGQYRLLRSKLF